MPMRMKQAIVLGLLLAGCAAGPVSPGMTLLAGINHYQNEMELFGMRSERWPERQRMGDFLKLTFAAALGGSPEFNRLVEIDQRKREFIIALRDSPLSPERVREMREEFVKMNHEMAGLKAVVKRQIAAIPLAAEDAKQRIEGIATIGLLTLAIDDFSAARDPNVPPAQEMKVGPYLVTSLVNAASVRTPEGQSYRCSTFVVEEQGVGINCEPAAGKS